MIDRIGDPIDLPMAPAAAPERGDAAANRVRILAAARRVVAERGPAALTMDAVADEACVGKGTIFRRFGDRAGLTGALIDEDMRNFQDGFLRGPPPLGPGAPPAKRLEAFAVGLLRHYAEHLDVVLTAGKVIGHETSPVFVSLLLHARALLRELDPELDDDVVARMLLNAIGPQVIADAFERGTDIDTLEESALALLRGLTGASRLSAPGAAPRR